ncbi:MAG: chemotaxis response regulator protein-glutamate methylesterase [Gammaproteobacteria bacterium]|nr:chemotaxis response regulator protein-glutamate methylesterase [Gammaproteobacteria bacterium]
MPVKVLVVDDSRFFRRRVAEMLSVDPALEIIGEAADGQQAVEQALKLKPDVITMDIEMPVMDGISATRKILAVHYVPILMFSSLTNEGAQATFDALEAGAVDYLPKRFEEFSNDKRLAGQKLCEKLLAVARVQRHSRFPRTAENKTAPSAHPGGAVTPLRPAKHSLHQANRTAPPPSTGEPRIRKGQISIVAIGTSTGGPVALQKILSALPADFSPPMLLIQHMPESFTGPFAQRLDGMCRISVKEAKDGDEVRSGLALLAPGGQQMELQRDGDRYFVHVYPAAVGQNYKPCIDITFKSVANNMPGKSLAIVLTGMGADGCEGAQVLKRMGSQIWVQDEATSVVNGMPSSVIEAGAADYVYPIDEIAKYLAQKV